MTYTFSASRRDSDAGDLDLGQRLAVALALVIPGLVLELVDDDLRALGVGDDLACHGDLFQVGCNSRDVRAVDEHDGGQNNSLTRCALELLDLNDIALGDLVL